MMSPDERYQIELKRCWRRFDKRRLARGIWDKELQDEAFDLFYKEAAKAMGKKNEAEAQLRFAQ